MVIPVHAFVKGIGIAVDSRLNAGQFGIDHLGVGDFPSVDYDVGCVDIIVGIACRRGVAQRQPDGEEYLWERISATA